ncbi:twin-arginine translocation signal domain-containing protein (plasmid) [Halolamina sp. CBA1230]|uniref:twin-arginine translocation signal domain-containing protein n=1 Tax=Halolamina sp. CBA1230 TaxID=1853690 RepID=UPI0009A2594C|nr:twin-arginine translocation signal domain-containing protein [Halolamina sp. CBA1230]QKY21979.1 twin-arginine translocation signal domain-containing protein [Halolamina sp. CBA1230]
MDRRLNRRRFLRATGVAAAVGGLAGCLGPDADVPDALHEYELEYSFERTFGEVGLELYVCEPHEGLGMCGAIDIVEVSLPLVRPSPRTIRRLGFGVSM